MNKEYDLILIIFKELLSRNIHGMDKETIKTIYEQAKELAQQVVK